MTPVQQPNGHGTQGTQGTQGTHGALDTSGIDHAVGFLLAVAEVPLRRVFVRHIGQPFDLRPVEFSLLALLLLNPGAAPKQLGQALNLSPPNVTVLVDRLCTRGLVERQRSATDGRAQRVLLTAAGSVLAQRARAVSLQMEDAALAALSPGERALLRELLVKLAGAAPQPAQLARAVRPHAAA